MKLIELVTDEFIIAILPSFIHDPHRSHIEQLSQKAYVMGISTDTELAHKAFLQYKDPTNGLGDTPLHFLLGK